MKPAVSTFLIICLATVIGSCLSILARESYVKIQQVDKLIQNNTPVVENMVIKGVRNTNGNLLIRIQGNKVRDCGGPLSIFGTYGKQQEYRFVQINFLDDLTDEGLFIKPDDNKTENDNDIIDFGWWELMPSPEPDSFNLHVIHNCDGVLVSTLIGSYKPADYIKE